MANELRLVVLISGTGSNLQALIDREQKGQWNANIVGVLCNNPKAAGLERAQKAGIPTAIIDHRLFSNTLEFEKTLLAAVLYFKPDLVLLAGFMRILSPFFIGSLEGRILNIHPSLLPAYKGLNTHEQVLAHREPYSGATVHWVTEQLDAGPIVGQIRVPVYPNDTVDSLRQRVLRAEHYLYPTVIERLACGNINRETYEYQGSDLDVYDPTTDTFSKFTD